ncbi:MAG: SDR family oxidoreductase [Allosphingosinicella sp.]|uniref:SDR family oxidoreductase n=1 Tax=Allosphingosinicella sp. TaxID=2823234 RepID=UPI0039547993
MSTPYSTALVTGASGLTGQAIVERLRKAGLTVHALSRDGAKLADLADRTGCIPHAVDVADTAALTSLLEGIEVDILVNNAGVGAPGPIARNDAAMVDVQVDVNLRAVLHLVRLTLPRMIARDRGHIVSIGSIAGHHNFPGNAAYHATKGALHLMTRQLRVDLFGTHVRVTEISPGRIRTEMFAKTLGTSAEEAEQQFFEGYEPLLPQDIANAVAYAVEAPQHVNVAHIEILPTMQVPGGLRMAKSAE